MDVFVNARHPSSVRIMGDYEVAIGGTVDVELEGVGAVSQRLLEGRKGVLRQQRRSPAMTVEAEGVSGLNHAVN